MKERIDKLLTVKSIVTFGLLLVFMFLSVRGDIESREVTTLLTSVIAFYFGTQAKKE
jgi:hypothetical protein